MANSPGGNGNMFKKNGVFLKKGNNVNKANKTESPDRMLMLSENFKIYISSETFCAFLVVVFNTPVGS
jgi:hypothetical protein